MKVSKSGENRGESWFSAFNEFRFYGSDENQIILKTLDPDMLSLNTFQ